MRLSFDPTPLLAAMALLMVSLLSMNLPAASVMLSLLAVAAGGACVFDHWPLV